jgi:predicted GTPase
MNYDDPLPTVLMPEVVVMSRQDAAKMLCELFLANADQGNHAGNDELVAELMCRIRAEQSRD